MPASYFLQSEQDVIERVIAVTQRFWFGPQPSCQRLAAARDTGAALPVVITCQPV